MRLRSKDPEPEEQHDEEPAALAVDVKPEEIPELVDAAAAVAKARGFADSLTGEATPENKAEFADALKALRDANRDAEDTRLKLTRQFDDAKKRIKAHVDELVSSSAAAYESLEARLLDLEQAERKADEDEQAAAQLIRDEEQEIEDAAAEAEERRPQHVPAPAPRRRPTGARGSSGAKASPTKELKYRIIDEAKIPDEYWRRELNRSKIQTDVRAGLAIDGVEPYFDESIRVN